MSVDIHRLCDGQVMPKTVDNYVYSWTKYMEYAKEEDVAFLPSTLDKFRDSMMYGSDYSRNTINFHVTNVKAIVTWLRKRGLVREDTYVAFKTVRLLRSHALPGRGQLREKVRIEPSEMRTICDSVRPDPHNPSKAMLRAILLLLATSGLRCNEAANLRVASLRAVGDNQYMIFNLIGKGNKMRDVPLSPEAYHAIQDWLFQRPIHSEYVFNSYATVDDVVLWSVNPISRGHLYTLVKDHLKRIGFGNIKTHDFRRFVGTQLARKDIRLAQRVLGHSSVEITAKYYVMDRVEAGVTNNLF